MADDKLIFPIGFDLEEGVKEVSKEWKSTYQKQLQNAIDDKPLKVKIDFESRGIDTKEFKQWMALSREAEKIERERIKNAKEWQKIADQSAMAETRRANATNESNARIERANRKAEASEQRKANAVRKTNQAYANQTTYLSRLIQRMGIYFGLHQATNFLRNIVDVTAEFELQRVALGSIIGDLNEANKLFEQIKAAAVKSPFEIKDLVAYTKQLAAYKIEQEDLFETTQRLADISAGLGVGMERLVLAYGQIRATGYLRGSEVRQLTEAGIPIVEALAEKMSQLRGETVSAAEVMGLISERAISFGMVKEVFEDMTDAGGMFYKMQEKQSETLRGQLSNLRDSYSIMFDEMGKTERINGIMKGTISLVKSLAENWRTVASVLGSVATSMGVYYVVMKNATIASKALSIAEATRLSTLRATTIYMPKFLASTKLATTLTHAYRVAVIKSATATGVLSKAFWRLTTAMLSNPYTAIIAALAGLATLLLTTESRTKRLNKELAKIGTEGTLQADQQVKNFERLANAIRNSTDGSIEQSEALAELKRLYGEFLPSQDASILNLIREKEGYDAVTSAIREKIALQIQEQKLNTIASEYGGRISKRESKLIDWLTGENRLSPANFSREEATRVTNAIKDAVDEGLLKSQKSWEDNAKEISKIIKAQTGKDVWVSAMEGVERDKYEKFVDTLFEMNGLIQDVENSMESTTGSLGKYTEKYDDFVKNTLSKVKGVGEEFTFEWSESKTRESIKAYNNFVANLLKDERVSFTIGDTIDFDSLYKTLGDKKPHLVNTIKKIQGEYSKLIPTGIDKLIRDKFQDIANELGVSMDLFDNYFKTSDKSTKDWVKSIEDSIETLRLKLSDLNKLQDQSSEGWAKGESFWRDYSEEIKNVTDTMSGLQLMLTMFSDYLSGSGKTTPSDNRLANLKEEISLLEKVYARYKEYRQYMSAEEAKAKTEGYFGDTIDSLRFGAAFDDDAMKLILNKYKDAMSKLPKSDKDVIELGFKIEDIDWNSTKNELEDELKKLSDDLSRTKTAKEFFDRILGLTGDKQLSASLTVSIYGGEMGDDLGERLARDMASKFQEQVQTYFGDIDISSAINEATGEIDPIKLEKLLTEENIKKIGGDNVIEIRKIINDLIKANADYANELFKSYEKFFDYEKRMTMVTQREEEERKKIRESMIPDDQKTQLEEASKKREQEQISAIEIEQLKDSADWEKTFEDLNNLGSLTIKNLISLLEDYIAKKKEAGEPIAESDMKTLMNELNQLRERDAQLDPFETIKDSLKDLIDATKEYNKAKKDGDEKGMANAQNKRAKALNKLETAVNAVASGFQNLSNLLTEFQELLGIEDDSAMGEVFNGAAKALGFVATALSTAIALTLLWNSTLWANPIFAGVAIVSGVLGAIAGVFSAISNAKVRRANEEIERQQELLDQLAYSYERLEKAQEKAFGSDYISNYEQRMANLQAQQEAYLKQAEAERSKGKKADEDKIKEYEEQARETADEIKDMQSELSEHFLGTDLTSAARDFAQSWIDAYKEFDSTTDAMKDKFQDMIENMIVESFAARVIQSALSDIFTEIDNMSKDGVLDVSEAAKIADMTDVAVGNIDVGMTNLMNALSQAGISVRGMGSDLTGVSKDIATASEESILGLAAGINTQNFYISQVPPKLDTIIALLQGGAQVVSGGVNLQDLVTLQNQHLSHLPNIAQNTAETVAECKAIVAETRRTADALERVIKPRGTQATHTVNTSL